MNPTLKAGLIGVIAAVVVLGLFLPRSSVVERIVEKLGATPGQDLPGPCISVNGAQKCYYGGDFADATTTLFAVQNPFQATSTAIIHHINGTNGTTSIILAAGTSSVRSLYGGSDGRTIGFLEYLNLFHLTVSTSTAFTVSSTELVGTTATSSNRSVIVLGPTDYLLVGATSTTQGGTTWDNGIVDGANEFTGRYNIEIFR